MSDLDSIIGSKISLISHQNIRYDGTLFSINQSESSIVLKDVVNFGTEDRVTDKSKIVPASHEVVKFITFPGQEIQDLYVHDEATAAAAAAAPAAPTPAPIASPVPPTPTPVSTTAAPVIPPIPPKPEPVPSSISSTNNNDKKTILGAGSGSHLLKMKEKRTNDSISKPISDLVKVDFDFQAGLNAFKNLTLDGKEDSKPTASYTYVKDDFFDDISTPASSSTGTRMSASEERQLNQDTFGAVALQSRRYYNNRGGRGNNAGGRGYRNNYNNYNNNYNNNNNGGYNNNRNNNGGYNNNRNHGGYNNNNNGGFNNNRNQGGYNNNNGGGNRYNNRNYSNNYNTSGGI